MNAFSFFTGFFLRSRMKVHSCATLHGGYHFYSEGSETKKTVTASQQATMATSFVVSRFFQVFFGAQASLARLALAPYHTMEGRTSGWLPVVQLASFTYMILRLRPFFPYWFHRPQLFRSSSRHDSDPRDLVTTNVIHGFGLLRVLDVLGLRIFGLLVSTPGCGRNGWIMHARFCGGGWWARGHTYVDEWW